MRKIYAVHSEHKSHFIGEEVNHMIIDHFDKWVDMNGFGVIAYDEGHEKVLEYRDVPVLIEYYEDGKVK